MSTPINDGGPAFPQITTDSSYAENGEAYGHTYSVGGMTLRDWFAGQALQGWCAAAPSVRNEPMNMTRGHADEIAQGCFRYADAMLAERNKSP